MRDDGDFDALYTAHYDALLRYALRRVTDPADAADVVAEAWTTAWRRRAELPGGDQDRLWLFGVARHVLANQRRGQLRRSHLTAGLRSELQTTTRATPEPETPVSRALDRAADAAIGARDPVVGPGQYLHTTTDGVAAFSSGLADGTYLTWLTRKVTEQWTPGDPSKDWVLRRGPVKPYRFYAPGDRERAQREGLLPDSPAQSSITRSQNGAFFGPVTPTWQSPTVGFLAALPLDPAALLRRIRRDAGDSGPSRDGEALVTIADVLRSGIVPADLRAALFRTAQLIPGVRVVDTETNLEGGTGVAVGRDEGRSFRQDIIFDANTGQVIGERRVALEAADGQPAGAVYELTAVRTDVVNAAP